MLFQCLWKRCGKVLSTASGMQRHIRLVHLGCGGAGRLGGRARRATASAPPRHVPSRRQAEAEQSDGEEDFYYTELDAGVDTLTRGLASLSPASPIASAPPAFPTLELPEPLARPHVWHRDHAYQVGEATGSSWGRCSGRPRRK